jgi:putative transposase
LAGVSRSGYYAWLISEEKRALREESDAADYEIIKDIFDRKNRKSGIRTIKMILENDMGIVMNLKRINRIKNKYNLITKVRRPNPYKKMMKANLEHKTCPNLLERNFIQDEPQKVLLTDITYLDYGTKGRRAYWSCVKDGSTNELVANYLSSTLKMTIVYETLDILEETLDGNIHPEALLHSDQGVHYTHLEFQKRVKRLGITQSMSRKGNCWDNAPMESSFGHFKDEVDLKQCETLEELQDIIDQYIHKYNHHRYQWTLNKMTPEQFRSHLLSA